MVYLTGRVVLSVLSTVAVFITHWGQEGEGSADAHGNGNSTTTG